ncbi:LVIVD repeat-containing protein, partial [Candidatus Thiomargarita nelsonii]
MISSVMRKSAPLLMLMLLGFLVSLPWSSVANELTVTKIGQWGGGGNYDDVAVAGNYAYAATGRGLAIVDISTPTAPTLAGSYDTSGSALGVAVDGNYAYVADGSSGL